MRAVLAVMAIPYRRSLLTSVLALIFPLTATVLALVLAGRRGAGPAVAMVAMLAVWILQLNHATCLRSICRRDSQLLPDLRRRVALGTGLQLALWVGFLVALAVYAGASAPSAVAMTIAAGALGLAAGTDQRAMLVGWLVFTLASWQPAFLAPLLRGVAQSHWNVVLALLLAAGVGAWMQRRLFAIDGEQEALSPLDAAESGRRPTLTTDDTTQRRGWLMRRLAPIFDAAAQAALDGALARWRSQPTDVRRVALVRAVLLPHDNARAVVLRVVLACFFVLLYLFVFRFGRSLDAGFVGAYAVLLGVARMIAVGHGLIQMRPHLTELYLTLAPTSNEAFLGDVERALRRLIPVSVLTCLVYALLGCVVLHAADPARVLASAAIAGVASSLTAFGVQLIAVESRVGRTVVAFVLSLGAMGAYWLVYALIGAFGYMGGALIGGLVETTIGVCAWRAGRGTYLARRPRFDVPL